MNKAGVQHSTPASVYPSEALRKEMSPMTGSLARLIGDHLMNLSGSSILRNLCFLQF